MSESDDGDMTFDSLSGEEPIEKIRVTGEDLKDVGDKILGMGVTTDEVVNYYGWGDNKKPLKFIVCKGYIDDWCIYVEAMDKEQGYAEVKDIGNKIHNLESIKLLVDCDEEVLGRYRQ